MNLTSWRAIGLIAALVVLTVAIQAQPLEAGNLEEAIAKTPPGPDKGQIDPSAAPGLMGIAGAPRISWFYGILWGLWVGWIFSSVGAFGGVMAGVGHITVFGLGDYAATFKKTSPSLSKLLTDSIRTSNQYLAALSALIASVTYYRMGRLVLPLAICLSAGGMLGAYLVPVLTAGKVDLTSYVGYFGVTVLVIGCFLLYETTPAGQNRKKAAKAVAAAFEREHMHKGETASQTNHEADRVRVHSWGLSRIAFSFYGVDFSFSPVIPVLGGFLISAISAFIGVGGGFLYVPFLTSVAGLPMYIVAGTSALAVLISMITSIFTYMFVKGVPVDFFFIGIQLVGIALGSILGPITSSKIPDIWLKRLFVFLALYVGIGYATKGFLGHSIIPGM